jgi:hypothetical protein
MAILTSTVSFIAFLLVVPKFRDDEIEPSWLASSQRSGAGSL